MTKPVITMAPELVTLKGGLVVAADALLVLWSLEERGFDVKLGDGQRYKVLVGPSDRLTAEDKALIHMHRDALSQLVRYVDHRVA